MTFHTTAPSAETVAAYLGGRRSYLGGRRHDVNEPRAYLGGRRR
jgi:hypothetical protein